MGQNRFLSALSAEVNGRLLRHLVVEPLNAGQVLFEPGDIVANVHFPIDSVVSLFLLTENGSVAEISTAGNDGLVGIASITGADCESSRAIVQNAGYAYRLPGQYLAEEFDRHGELMLMIISYTQFQFAQAGQAALCNRHHTVDQRLCRWLLQTLDRLNRDRVNITHEMIAGVLGVRREAVTLAVGRLQTLGAIKHSRRGQIAVIDRPRLEHLSCECRAVAKRESERSNSCAHRLLAKWRNAHPHDRQTGREWRGGALKEAMYA